MNNFEKFRAWNVKGEPGDTIALIFQQKKKKQRRFFLYRYNLT